MGSLWLSKQCQVKTKKNTKKKHGMIFDRPKQEKRKTMLQIAIDITLAIATIATIFGGAV